MPQYKNGRYSKALTKDLSRAYHEAKDDPELCDLRHELGLLTVRANLCLEKLGKDPPPPWREALTALGDLSDALEDGVDYGPALAALDGVLRGGLDATRRQERAWAEVRELVQERTKVVQAESRRLGEMGQTVTKERVLALFGYVSDSILRHVNDAALYQKGPVAVLDAIRRDMDVVLGAPRGTVVDSQARAVENHAPE